MKKQLLRELFIKIRNSIPNDDVKENSDIIRNIILEDDNYKKAKNIFIYISYGKEVQTYGIIIDAIKQEKNVLVPKISGDGMEAVSCNLKTLRLNSYGIMEPDKFSVFDGNKIDLCIAPGVAFDKERNRLGFGKGYYDKYINKYPQMYVIGLAHDVQIVDKIEAEENDKKLHKIITEKRAI